MTRSHTAGPRSAVIGGALRIVQRQRPGVLGDKPRYALAQPSPRPPALSVVEGYSAG
jgi:hypothetical protein